jgi:hypothetical protein
MCAVSETPPPPYGEQPPEPPDPYGQPGQPGQQPPQPYGQSPAQPYGQQPVPYGQPAPYAQPNPYGQTPYGAVQDHPQATLILILGILGLVVCGLIAPFAWVMGNRVVGEIDASNGGLGGRSTANAGRICGIVGSVLIILALVLFVGIFLLAAVTATTTSP